MTLRTAGPRGLVLGHRGAPADAPENTMRAFRLALEQGADGVELDVRASADGQPVVVHDATLERTAGRADAVASLTAAQLGRLDLGGGEGVPPLEAVAGWAAASGAWLNVELKEPGIESVVVEVLRRQRVLERCIVSSFHPAAIAAVGRMEPGARRFLLTERWDRPTRAALERSRAQGVCLAVDAATADVLAALAVAGLPVVVWTVDDGDRIEELLRAGVLAVISNRPALAAARRAALGGV